MHSFSSNSSLPPRVTQAHSGAKPSHVVLFLLQEALRNQKRHIDILVPALFEHPVQHRLNVLPKWHNHRAGK